MLVQATQCERRIHFQLSVVLHGSVYVIHKQRIMVDIMSNFTEHSTDLSLEKKN